MTELEKARTEIDGTDEEIARLFQKRMKAVENIARYKKANGLEICDEQREKRILIEKSMLVDEKYRDYYLKMQQAVMDVSKQYQYDLTAGTDTEYVKTRKGGYYITVRRGSIDDFAALTGIAGKALIVTDDMVPKKYPQKIAAQLEQPFIYTVPHAENGKSMDILCRLLSFMLQNGFTRHDCVVACGGGMVGDLAGFCAASYMRGVKFYNFPTTVLSQVDSSVGGKTAVNLDGIKNPVGAFYQPVAVVIDGDVLKTLDKRQVSSGLAEALKMSVTSDGELFDIFENGDIYGNIDRIIMKSVKIKKRIVELDEKESNVRKILNFGHTAGHAIESTKTGLYHGECVALGMLAFCSDEVKSRLIKVYKRLGLEAKADFDIKAAVDAVAHDKKALDGKIDTVFVEKIGECEIRKMSIEEIEKRLEAIRGEKN